jgi:hypothetical protein
MRFSLYLSCFLGVYLADLSAAAQFIPEGLSYQAIARETGGNELVNQSLTVRITILTNSITGDAALQEVHDVVTNAFGLFQLTIGQGIPTGVAPFDQLSELNWGQQPHFIRVEVDTPLSEGFVFLGTTALLAVPYAYHAATADRATEIDGDPANELITGLQLNNAILSIEEAGITHTLDLAPLTPAAADASPSNELITAVVAQGTTLSVTEGGQITDVDASSIAYATWSPNNDDLIRPAGNVGIGVPPTSSLHVEGSAAFAVRTVQAPNGIGISSTLTGSDCAVICNVSNGPVFINLPPAATCAGRRYDLRKFFTQTQSTFDLVVLPTGTDTIDGMTEQTFGHLYAEYITVVSDGLGWYILQHSKATP